MSTKSVLEPSVSMESKRMSSLLQQYGCGLIQFAGIDNALYERHLLFDSVIDRDTATTRDQFEAIAHSVRDILSQRWVLTEKTYDRKNPRPPLFLSRRSSI